MAMQNHFKELTTLFTRLGFIAFGGPAAHIAMMRDEVVGKRKWLNDQSFLDLVGTTNLIPGPNSTEMSMHIGQERAGWKGLIIAGLSFIIPAVLITAFFAWLYKKYGELPQVQPFIYGIKPAIIAVILAAIVPLAKQSLKNKGLILLAATALALALFGVNELLILFGAGFIALVITIWFNKKKHARLNGILPFGLLQVSHTILLSITNTQLFFIFLKIGAILYGSGYVLFAFLDAELVTPGILSREQLTDAIAVGQITPGPVFSSVTFIGYQLNGWSGAAVATVGIFVPSFLFVALLNPLVKKLRTSKLFSSFLDAVNAASVALIAAICIEMGRESILGWRTIFIAALSIVLAVGFKKINSALIVLGGSLLGYILTLI